MRVARWFIKSLYESEVAPCSSHPGEPERLDQEAGTCRAAGSVTRVRVGAEAEVLGISLEARLYLDK